MIGICLSHPTLKLLYFLLWSECLCPPPKSYVEILIPDVMVLVHRALRGA